MSVCVCACKCVLHLVTPSPCLSGPGICACPTGLSSKTSKKSSGHRKMKKRKNQLRPKAAVTEKIVITSLTSRREPRQPSLPRGTWDCPPQSGGSCPSTESEWGTRPMGLGTGEGQAISAWVGWYRMSAVTPSPQRDVTPCSMPSPAQPSPGARSGLTALTLVPESHSGDLCLSPQV